MIEERVKFSVRLNGKQEQSIELPSHWRLIDYLHEIKNLSGTKLGCGAGYCKACTVVVRHDDGSTQAIPACSTSLKTCNGWDIVTIEGIGTEHNMHPLQEAFIDNYAFQCGYCTPGFLLEGYSLCENLRDQVLTDDNVEDLVHHALEGHLCRCTGYLRYYEATLNVVKPLCIEANSSMPILNHTAAMPAGQYTANVKWELLRLLHEAAEVENSLMLQYLYAAFSIKRPHYASLAGFGHRAPGKPLDFLAVAIEEMNHLDTVNRLTVALGGKPNLVRQDFPWEPDIYPFPLVMEPLSRVSVAKYLYVEGSLATIEGDAEVKALLASLLPNQRDFNPIGPLYERILALLAQLQAAQPDLIDYTLWQHKLRVVQDEGDTDHYEFFRSLLLGTHPAFHGVAEPWSHPVGHPLHINNHFVRNPTAFSGKENTIQHDIARALGMLANRHYWMAMSLLEVSYRCHGRFHPAARRHMAGPLLQLCWCLPEEYGVPVPFDKFPMDFYSGLTLPDQFDLMAALLQDIEHDEELLQGFLPAAYLQSSRETCAEIGIMLLDSKASVSTTVGTLTPSSLLVNAINWFAADDDMSSFVKLVAHPDKTDVSEKTIRLLFRAAPFVTVTQILNIKGVGNSSIDTMQAAIQLKLQRQGQVHDGTLYDRLQQASLG